jgi:BirA family biotin operon repressor/biotin-[acetyl-CoA-carboxylase] ligase
MREKILELLNKKDFVSGETLANQLDVSRTAIWKQIKILQNLGYEIESVKNRGYRLISRPDIPLSEEISAYLDTEIVGKKIAYFDTIDSTNSYGKKLVGENTVEGTVIVAGVQTKGRGRKDRTWSSPRGGLWFSVVLYPDIPPQNAMLVTMASSISVAQGIVEVTGVKPDIKWPNDLLIRGKKVCGILTELDAEMDKINYSIVGIGINVNNKIDDDLKDIATSVSKEVGKNVSRVKLLKSIIKNLDNNYFKLIAKDYDTLRKDWFSYANFIGKKIKISGEKSIIKGIASDIDDSGCLIVKTPEGNVRVISGDLSIE